LRCCRNSHFYRYCLNDPVNLIDPFGLEFSSGVSYNVSTINPFTSGGGGVWGLNIQNFYDGNDNVSYLYSGSGVGLDIGAAMESVWAWGSGSWEGPIESVNFSFLWFAGSIFWTPGEGGWAGFTFGLGVGLPGLATEETNYERLGPDPCK